MSNEESRDMRSEGMLLGGDIAQFLQDRNGDGVIDLLDLITATP
jgi:hypothetical protein